MENFQITKPQILSLVRNALLDGTVSHQEIAELLGGTPAHGTPRPPAHAVSEVSPPATTTQPSPAANDDHLTTTQLLQYIGGFVVLLGIGTFVATFWGDLAPIGRVTIALGATLVAFMLGTVLFYTDKKSQSGVAFHLIAGCLAPFAALVLLDELFFVSLEASTISLVSLALLLIYAGTYYVLRHLIFTFFMLSSSIAFLYSTLYVIMPGQTVEFWAHLTLLVGAAGIYVGQSFRGTPNEPLSELMYFLGGAALLISPAVVFSSMPAWELLYPFVLAFALYLAVYLRSRRLLTLTVLALMGYVMYLTGTYFADVVGWPIALIITGVLMIAIGYAALKYKDTV